MSRTVNIQQNKNPLKLTYFPLEIIHNIFSNLDKKSLYNVLITNKTLSKVAIACLWNDISLTNRVFLPFLLTFIEYYSLYYEVIFSDNDEHSQKEWYNMKIEQFYKEYIKHLNSKERKDLNRLTKYYIQKEKLSVPYYPYLSYIKNVNIENIDEEENGNELKENIELVQSLKALSTFLKYSYSQPMINTKPTAENTILDKIKSLFNIIPFTQYLNPISIDNHIINTTLPIMNIQKLLVENVYVSNQSKVHFKDSLFKYSNNLKVIDLFYCEFPYSDLLYLPIYCPNIITLFLDHVNYDEFILLCYLFQFKNLRNFGFSINKPLSPFTLYILKNNYNNSCLSKLKSLRLDSSKDLLLNRYNDEDSISSSDLPKSYIEYFKERKNTRSNENENENNDNNINNNDNENGNNDNNINNNDNENGNNDNNINNNDNDNENNDNNINNNDNENENNTNLNNNNEITNENSIENENDDNENYRNNETISIFLNKYYYQFKNIMSYIEKRNDNSLNYDEIKNLSIDLDKFLSLINNPGYCTWKYIAKSCHNLTHLTLSFPVKYTILKSFFINNPYLEVVVIQDIKLRSRPNPQPLTTKWDRKIQKKEEENNFESFPVLTHLKSLILHSSYTYRLWFNIMQFNGWLKKLPKFNELKLFIIEPIPKYFYNIHNIMKDCYHIESLVISGPWFNGKCIKTLIDNEKNNNNSNHLKSLTISLSDEVEPVDIKNLLRHVSIEKLELNVPSSFDIKELFNDNCNFDPSSIRINKSTYCLLNDDINMIKSTL